MFGQHIEVLDVGNYYKLEIGNAQSTVEWPYVELEDFKFTAMAQDGPRCVVVLRKRALTHTSRATDRLS